MRPRDWNRAASDALRSSTRPFVRPSRSSIQTSCSALSKTKGASGIPPPPGSQTVSAPPPFSSARSTRSTAPSPDQRQSQRSAPSARPFDRAAASVSASPGACSSSVKSEWRKTRRDTVQLPFRSRPPPAGAPRYRVQKLV